MSHALGSPFPALATADALNARVRAGFVLANVARSAQSCPVKIIADIGQHAAEQGLSEAEALENGMRAKLKEFVKEGAENHAEA
jgi:phosphomethylpyrimidine synthase